MVLFFIGTLLILLFLAWGTFQTARLLKDPPPVNLLLLPPENLLRLGLIATCFWLGQVSGLSFAQLGWASVDPVRDLLVGIGVGVGVAVLVPPLTQAAVKYLGPHVYSPVIVRSILPRTRREWLLVPLSLLATVFLEELLFRSLLLGGFGILAPPVLLAIAWSVAFGVLHLPQGSLGVVVAGLLGLLLSALFLTTGGLLAPLIAHYLINLLQLAWAAHDRSFFEFYGRSPSADADASSHP